MPDRDLRGFLKHYQRLVEQIRAANGEAHIVISGILPRSTNRFAGSYTSLDFIDRCNRNAMLANRALERICDKTPYLTYVGHPQFCDFEGQVNRKFISTDGLHLFPAGVVQLWRDMRRGVEAARKKMVRSLHITSSRAQNKKYICLQLPDQA